MMNKLCLVLALTSCAAGLDSGPDSTTTPVVHEPTVLAGGYLNDEPTFARVTTLLAGIEWEAVCSLGCTLYVQQSRAEEARERLRGEQSRAAAANVHLWAENAKP